MTADSSPQRPRLTLVPPPVQMATGAAHNHGLRRSFIGLVVLPLAVAGAYLLWFAADQYESHVGFSVRAEGPTPQVEFLGGLTELAGTGSQDGLILEEFLRSQSVVEEIDRSLDLPSLFGKAEADPLYTLDPAAPIEDLHDVWLRMIHVTHDASAGLLDVRVRAFAPEDAQAIADAILQASEALVERLSDVAQADTIAFAQAELTRAEARLRDAREEVRAFRSTTQIVDPGIDLQGRMGLLATLQQELAVALIDTDLLRGTTQPGDIRLAQAQSRIAVIEAQIDKERRKLGAGGALVVDGDYAGVVSMFEKLSADRAFAEQSYTLALAAYDTALAEARRKSRYLAVHIAPTRAQTAQYPERLTLFGLTALFLTALWASLVLIYYSLRDRR